MAETRTGQQSEPQAVQTTQTIPERGTREIKGLLPLYMVILHNDPVHPMDYVVQALLKSVPSLTAEDAASIMLKAHNEGRAVVIVCPLEPAELYRDRIRSFSLVCSIEQA